MPPALSENSMSELKQAEPAASPDIVAESLRAVDAAVRPGELIPCYAGSGILSPRGHAIVKIFHQYDQFTLRGVKLGLRLVRLRTADVGGGWGTAFRWSGSPLTWRDNFRLKGERRRIRKRKLHPELLN